MNSVFYIVLIIFMKAKNLILAALGIISLAIISPTFAATWTNWTGTMMKHDDTMMMHNGSGTMMKHDDTMMMHNDAKKLKKLSVYALAKKLWYAWNKDKATLAIKAGITNYTGTKQQNISIRIYLLKEVK